MKYADLNVCCNIYSFFNVIYKYYLLVFTHCGPHILIYLMYCLKCSFNSNTLLLVRQSNTTVNRFYKILY